jgi:hypothetical protein
MTLLEKNIVNDYIGGLTDEVCKIISNKIDLECAEYLIREHFTNRLHERNSGTKFKHFQLYYYKTLKNRSYYRNNPFFSEFRQKYSLRGIDKSFIVRLEKEKNDILQMIEANKLDKLYSDYFAKAPIKHKDKKIEKNLGSFFTKIVHTFRPDEYTPLDNAIKKYFGISGESYFIAMIIISKAYQSWASKNKSKMSEMKKLFCKDFKEYISEIESNEITELTTDLKLLNLLFWSIAEKEERIGSL